MKYQELHFEEYISSNQKEDLHPKLNKIFQKFPKKINELHNVLFYGPSGVGKYTQMLKSIKRYSSTELKYEKKISIIFNKQQYFFRISDIHYEIDMSLLGCNSKLLWHDIYLQIVDIISAKTEKSGIIVCKYFHEIHSELLENFYSYMQQNNSLSIKIKFMLITENISFIPDNILNCCEVINVPRPTKLLYNKCLKNKLPINFKLENILNIKNMHNINNPSVDNVNSVVIIPHKIICNKIIDSILKIDDLKFLKFRDLIYDIFIYNLDINECIWYIISSLIIQQKIGDENISLLMVKIYVFFQYYNNNYRPIYHVENLLFYIVSIIHKFNQP